MWLWGLLAVLFVILFVSWRLTSVILFPETYTPEESFEAEVASGHLDPVIYQRLPKEEISIRSPFGYTLTVYIYPMKVRIKPSLSPMVLLGM